MAAPVMLGATVEKISVDDLHVAALIFQLIGLLSDEPFPGCQTRKSRVSGCCGFVRRLRRHQESSWDLNVLFIFRFQSTERHNKKMLLTSSKTRR